MIRLEALLLTNSRVAEVPESPCGNVAGPQSFRVLVHAEMGGKSIPVHGGEETNTDLK